MSQFMFRRQELKRILSALRDGRSVLLVGIRRTGKTRLMKEALRQQKEFGPVYYLDVADYTQLYAFYRDLLSAMPKGVMNAALDLLKCAGNLPNTVMNWLRNHVDKVSGLGVEVDLNAPEDQERLVRYWESVVKALLEILEKTPHDQLPVVAIDELPFMLENLLKRGVSTDEITVTLASLRKLRDAGLRMLIGGSISLENLLSVSNIPHTVLGGLTREVLPPFTQAEAHEYLQINLEGCAAQEAIPEALGKLPDFVPHFLVETAHYLKGLETSDEVGWTMETQVLPAIRRTFLHQFQERLEKNYTGEERTIANALLDQMGRHGPAGGRINTAKLPENATRVLTKLQYDMFFDHAPDLGYRFSLQLLGLWWRSQRGLSD